MKTIYLILGLLFFNLGCKSQKANNNLLGNVYSFEGECKKWTNKYVNGFRIDKYSKDSISIKLSYHTELLMTIPMLYNLKSKQFESKFNIDFYEGKNNYSSKISLKIINDTLIRLNFKKIKGV